MRMAGGVIGIIAGVFGVLAAIVTLGIGGMSTAFSVENSSTVVYLGWGGIGFSFLTIVLSAIAISAEGRLWGALLIACSVAGAILGGTIVAVFMILAFIGGILACIGGGRRSAAVST